MNYPAPGKISTAISLPIGPRVLYYPENRSVTFQVKKRETQSILWATEENTNWFGINEFQSNLASLNDNKTTQPFWLSRKWLIWAIGCFAVVIVAYWIYNRFKKAK